MHGASDQPPSLENLIESGSIGVGILHPGDLEITRDLARACHIGRGTLTLDVASGTGESAFFLTAEFGAQVMGVDIAQELLSRAARNARERNLQGAFLQADAHILPFPAGIFDCAISECTLCLLNKEEALREMARAVKAGGFVGMHDVCWRELPPPRMASRLAQIEGERPESVEGWKSLFEGAGLVDVRAFDKSPLLTEWVAEIRSGLGPWGEIQAAYRILRWWGVRGLIDILRSERILRSRYLGYGMIVGRKPEPT